jgi:hypothetical protein
LQFAAGADQPPAMGIPLCTSSGHGDGGGFFECQPLAASKAAKKDWAWAARFVEMKGWGFFESGDGKRLDLVGVDAAWGSADECAARRHGGSSSQMRVWSIPP